MDFTERFELYKEGGMITDADIEDIKAVIVVRLQYPRVFKLYVHIFLL